MGDEADRVNDMFNDDYDMDGLNDHATSYSGKVQIMLARYKANKEAKVGTMIRCANCGARIVKTTYHKQFCTNGKTKKDRKSSCKDRYWNTVDTTRRERAMLYQSS